MASKQQSKNTDYRNARRAMRARKVMSVANKMKVLEMLDNGETETSVGCFGGVSRCIICTVKKNEKAIRASISRGTSESLRKSFLAWNIKTETMEKDWHVWLLTQRKRNRPPLVCILCQWAPQKCKFKFRPGPNVVTFIARIGWLDRFEKRSGLCEKKWPTEEEGCEAAAEYPEYRKKLREENGCVFSADEPARARSACLFAHLLQRMRKRPEASSPGKTSSKFHFVPVLLMTFWPNPCCFTDSKNPCPLKREC